MKKIALILLSALSFSAVAAQSDTTTWFDFWIGDWTLTWTDADGKEVHGENTISKIHNGKVIFEDFRSPSQQYTGTSYSVYNPRRKEWKQTWVDSEGGYITLTGSNDNGMPIFESTETIPKGNQRHHYRMVFHSITPQGLTWEWQSSPDRKQWKTEWKIFYERNSSK